jgi:hypothetical protein
LEVGDKNRSDTRIEHGGPDASMPPLFSDNRGPGIVWSETIRKEARGMDAFDLGEVHAVERNYVKTKRGLFRKETFCLPRNLAEAFDGSILWFRVTPDQAETEFRNGRRARPRKNTASAAGASRFPHG